MEKKINYLARNFEDIRKELLELSKRYYPEMTDTFNDASVGAWLLDIVSAVGDDLSYHTDRMYQETNINSANLKSTLLNIARANGVKIPGSKVSMCEVEVSCRLPIDPDNIAAPDWSYAPLLKRDTVFAAGQNDFEMTEDVNFAEQFNKSGFSNRRFKPVRNSNGIIIGYDVFKTTIVVGGKRKIFKKIINSAELEPFMEIVLPEQNIVNVESVIFKESGDFNINPDISEFYVDEEEFRLTKESITTYRFFETDCLAEQYRLGVKSSLIDYNVVRDLLNPYEYEDYYEDGIPMHRYYKAQWKALTQKFITEYTDKNYLKLIFGSGNGVETVPSNMTNYGESVASNIINNNMLGVLPRAGWVMYVLYRTGGGIESNIAQDTLNRIVMADVVIPSQNATDQQMKSQVIKSLKVTNKSVALGGKDPLSVAELRNFIKYNIGAQDRCVTLKDYKGKIAQIPGQYGCPFRCNFIEENNKIVMGTLNIDHYGKLKKALPSAMVDNIKEYLSHYKNMTDYVEIKSGRIYNLGIEIDVFIDKNYNTPDVIKAIIEKVRSYMDVNNHDMGEDIFVGDLEKEINSIDGVINLIDLRVFNIYDGEYSSDQCPLNRYSGDGQCGTVYQGFSRTPDGAKAFQIDLDQVDHVLYADYNSMYEILNPENDIVVRAKLK